MEAVRCAEADQETAEARFTQLTDLGYVCRKPGEREFEPGIPSLMDYVRGDGRPPD